MKSTPPMTQVYVSRWLRLLARSPAELESERLARMPAPAPQMAGSRKGPLQAPQRTQTTGVLHAQLAPKGAAMKPVTHTPKRYVYTCAACGLLFETPRSDKLTCSPACRVTGHRSGEIKALRAMAKLYKVTPGQILESSAIDLLCPDLGAAIRAGTLSWDDAVDTAHKRFDERVAAALRMPHLPKE